MKIAMMQPYFMPYIGYFQLINAVDQFVICDNMQYTRRGWFNRNRILNNGSDMTFSIPIKKNKSFVNVDQISLAENSIRERNRILKQISVLYARAPYFAFNYPLIRRPFLKDYENLFDFIHFSIKEVCSKLDIDTKIVVCSEIDINHELKGQDRVLEIVKNLGGDVYINATGGKSLYDKVTFNKSNIELKFIKSKPIEYQQYDHEFVPWLSIIDVLMFNDIATVKKYLNQYDLE